jgi:hypothetical protein
MFIKNARQLFVTLWFGVHLVCINLVFVTFFCYVPDVFETRGE